MGVKGSESVARESSFVTTADGARIHCLISGSGPTIVFLPGYLMPVEVWERQIDYFSSKCRVVAIDPRSQGRSSQETQGHSPLSRAQDIAEVVDKLGIESFTFVAWSLGVKEALAYFRNRRLKGEGHKVNKLILVEGGLSPGLTPTTVEFWCDQLRSIQIARQEAFQAFVLSMFKREPEDKVIRRILESGLAASQDTALALAFGAIAYDVEPFFDDVDVPVLAVLGENDLLRSEFVRLLSVRPTLRLVELDGGHAVFYDDPDNFNRLIDDFVAHS